MIRRRNIVLAGAIFCIVSVGAAAYLLGVNASTGSADVRLDNGVIESLSQDGVEIRAADAGDSPTKSQEEAIAAARLSRPQASVKEVELVRFVIDYSKPPVDKLVWAVSFEPSTVGVDIFAPAEATSRPGDAPQQQKAMFAVSFVDAETGLEILYAVDSVADDSGKTITTSRSTPSGG